MKDNKGFTLVEMAIVLVIIGIILAGVLKGEELINNAKMKRTYSLYRETMAAYYTYLDKYQRFPGDDNTVATRTGWVASVDGNNNGRIDGGV
ncbi:MAG TPA: prepilin-type N-terminal cleavage/methylation domain-containing protein, partial [Nitrospirae bacterium]|nr:prepilin-type N-terminal cleavage/methylation domain-containing protein [Nitrospirota bacterium]